MKTSLNPNWKQLVKKFGFIGFMFFLIKGLLWIVLGYLGASVFF